MHVSSMSILYIFTDLIFFDLDGEFCFFKSRIHCYSFFLTYVYFWFLQFPLFGWLFKIASVFSLVCFCLVNFVLKLTIKSSPYLFVCITYLNRQWNTPVDYFYNREWINCFYPTTPLSFSYNILCIDLSQPLYFLTKLMVISYK